MKSARIVKPKVSLEIQYIKASKPKGSQVLVKVLSAEPYRPIGSYTGTLNDLIELVSLARRRIIGPLVSNRFKLNQATEALQMLEDEKIVGRGVINP